MSAAGSARLLGARGTASGGGLALPDVFREVLVTLLDAGPSPERVLRKVIREQLEYKQARVLAVWGSWDAFCTDVLEALADAGFIIRRLDSWEITALAVPGRELTVLRDPWDRARKIRVRFHSPRVRQAREVMARARVLAGDLVSYLEEYRGLSPALARAFEAGERTCAELQAAMQEEIPEGQPVPAARPGPGRSRKDGRPLLSGQNAWYRDWAPSAGWHTQEDARAEWNRLFPDKFLRTASASAFRHEARRMVESGTMTRRPGADRRHGAWEYRWIPEGERQ